MATSNKRAIEELARELNRTRAMLLQGAAASREELYRVVEEQESEFEETAQKDRITRLTSRLNERDQQKIREIDLALERMAKSNYGKCENCGRDIGIQRLQAMPSARLCISCAAAREKRRQSGTVESPSERLPVRDLEELTKQSPLGTDTEK